MAFYKKLSEVFLCLKQGVEEKVFPGAVAGIIYQNQKFIFVNGYKSISPFLEPLEETDIFDLASLTKPLALAFTFMYLLENNPKIDLYTPIGKYININEKLAKIPVYRFLNHTSGLKAWYPFYKKISNNKNSKLEKVVKIIETLPLEYEPGRKSLYSDLNYFLLTYLLENVYNKSFLELFRTAKNIIPFTNKAFFDFIPLKLGIDQENIVPTSICPFTKKILRGIVEDENTRALGGVSGVAGLFANIYGVLKILEFLLLTYKGEIKNISKEVVKLFFDFRENFSSFSLGFMLPSFNGYKATGRSFSQKTVGHLGFTGCSFFIDLERDLIVVLLSNRVHLDRNNQKIKSFRPVFHETVLKSLT